MWPEDTPRPDPERRVFRMEIPKEQIRDFLDSLERQQQDYFEAAVEAKERRGFPEATEVIKNIMSLK